MHVIDVDADGSTSGQTTSFSLELVCCLSLTVSSTCESDLQIIGCIHYACRTLPKVVAAANVVHGAREIQRAHHHDKVFTSPREDATGLFHAIREMEQSGMFGCLQIDHE